MLRSKNMGAGVQEMHFCEIAFLDPYLPPVRVCQLFSNPPWLSSCLRQIFADPICFDVYAFQDELLKEKWNPLTIQDKCSIENSSAHQGSNEVQKYLRFSPESEKTVKLLCI